MLCLLPPLLAPAARAGSYSGPVYSGGTWYGPGPDNVFGTYHDSARNGGWGGGSGGTNTATCGDQIDAAFTWHPDPALARGADPPPQSVITIETSQTEASGASYPPGTVGGSCDDGFSHSQSMTQTPIYAYPGSSQQVGTSGASACNGTRYGVAPGDAVVTHCTPTASASAATTASSSLTYTLAISPVTIQITGTTLDSGGGENILIGQHCGASLAGIPSACTISYQWSVSGSTFQTWSSDTPAPYNPDASYYVDGPGDLTAASPGWYWHDIGNGSSKLETVSCTATVTPPTGQGSYFTVTATKQVKVWVPSWAAFGTGGTMRVDTAFPGYSGSDFWLYAGPIIGSGETGGMDWRCTVASPISLFSDGSIVLVQTLIPSVSYTNAFSTYTWSLNEQYGLDTSYPYGWTAQPPSYPTYFAGDAPGIDLTYYNATAATVADQFEDYLMFFAPGSVQCVPLAHFVWSTDGSVTEPSSGGAYSWAYWSGSAGTVSPSGSRNFFPSNSFPMWTQNSGNNPPSDGHF